MTTLVQRKRRPGRTWFPGDLRYRENPKAPKPPWWNTDKADRAVDFFRRVLRHTKGEWYGKPFQLLYWQEAFLRDVFGPVDDEGYRIVRDAWLEIPRKNGKTELVAGIGLYLLVMDGEPGAEIYGAAADKEQASLTFNAAKTMVKFSAGLSKRLTVYRSAIAWLEKESVYRSLSSEAFTKHGLNASGILFDEVHAQPNDELWDVLETSVGARRQPLTVGLTTAGHDRTSLAWRLHEYYLGVQEGRIRAPRSVAYIYAAPEKADWKNEKTWVKCNPSVGEAVKLEYLQQACQKAIEMPSKENTFKRLHLNIWTELLERWLDMAVWDDCSSDFDPKQAEGERVYAGIDLSSKIDLTALALWFPDRKALAAYFWLPSSRVKYHRERNKLPYTQWERDGWLRVTEGDAVDQGRVFADTLEILKPFQLQQFGFDAWNAGSFSQWLDDAGLDIVDMRQGMKSLSEPTKELERLVVSRELNHGGNPILRWNAANTSIRRDENDNIRPVKPKEEWRRIDGVVAAVMAIGRAVINEPRAGSVYDDRGMFVFGGDGDDDDDDLEGYDD